MPCRLLRLSMLLAAYICICSDCPDFFPVSTETVCSFNRWSCARVVLFILLADWPFATSNPTQSSYRYWPFFSVGGWICDGKRLQEIFYIAFLCLSLFHVGLVYTSNQFGSKTTLNYYSSMFSGLLFETIVFLIGQCCTDNGSPTSAPLGCGRFTCCLQSFFFDLLLF